MNPRDLCIFCATDNAFAQHLAVTLLTLFESVRARHINLHVALIGVAPDHVAKLRALCTRPNVTASFAPFDMSRFSAFRTSETVSIASYARIFSPHFLPASWEKAIYLDCDLLICKDISPLWDVDISGFAIAGVPNPGADRNQDLGMPPEAPYVNAGVLVMNLTYWRANRLSQRIASYARQNPDRLQFYDQCAINACLYDQVLTLPFKWNVIHTLYLYPWTHIGGISRKNLAQLRRNPAIVHFTGPTKPWKYSTIHPFKEAYWDALSRTPYASVQREVPSFTQICDRQMRRLARPVKRAARISLHLAKSAVSPKRANRFSAGKFPPPASAEIHETPTISVK